MIIYNFQLILSGGKIWKKEDIYFQLFKKLLKIQKTIKLQIIKAKKNKNKKICGK